MRHIRTVLAVVALMAAMLLVMVTPAFADKGGFQHEGSCGVGKQRAHQQIENPGSPGASDVKYFSPSQAGCTG